MDIFERKGRNALNKDNGVAWILIVGVKYIDNNRTGSQKVLRNDGVKP